MSYAFKFASWRTSKSRRESFIPTTLLIRRSKGPSSWSLSRNFTKITFVKLPKGIPEIPTLFQTSPILTICNSTYRRRKRIDPRWSMDHDRGIYERRGLVNDRYARTHSLYLSLSLSLSFSHSHSRRIMHFYFLVILKNASARTI